MGSATLQLVMVTMRFFWLFLAFAVMADNDKTEIAPAHTFNCPMDDINLALDNNLDNLDNFPTIDNWQECAHICNAVSASDPSRCRFWTLSPSSGCWLKSSADGLKSDEGYISG